MNARDRLAGICETLRSGHTPDKVTVRTLLSWFGVERRGRHHVRSVRFALERAGLVTEPDFAGAYIDGAIEFRLMADTVSPIVPTTINVTAEQLGGSAAVTATATVESIALLSGAIADPTYRVSRLAPANKSPLSVTPETPLQEAVTLMLLYDYSQLPVMQSAYSVKGAISWKSIGTRLSLKAPGDKAKDFMENVRVIASTDSIFGAIPEIVRYEFVLVKDETNQVVGILTTTDLSDQLRTSTEPFLLLDEIENHVRLLIADKFTLEEAKTAQHNTGDDRVIESVADLNFGEYIWLLDHAERWPKICLPLDRTAFIKQLHAVREIRNDVMHFDPEGIGEDELGVLRSFVAFLQEWQKLSVHNT